MVKWIEVMELDARDRDIKMCGDAEELECGTFIPVKAIDRMTVESKKDCFDMYLTIHTITGQTYIAGDSLWLQRDLIGYKVGMSNDTAEAMRFNRFKRDVIQNMIEQFTADNTQPCLTTHNITVLNWDLFHMYQDRYGVDEDEL